MKLFHVIKSRLNILFKLRIGNHSWVDFKIITFTKSPVINQYHIIIVPVKITGIFCPTLYAAGISMKIKDQPFGIFPEKM